MCGWYVFWKRGGRDIKQSDEYYSKITCWQMAAPWRSGHAGIDRRAPFHMTLRAVSPFPPLPALGAILSSLLGLPLVSRSSSAKVGPGPFFRLFLLL